MPQPETEERTRGRSYRGRGSRGDETRRDDAVIIAALRLGRLAAGAGGPVGVAPRALTCKLTRTSVLMAVRVDVRRNLKVPKA